MGTPPRICATQFSIPNSLVEEDFADTTHILRSRHEVPTDALRKMSCQVASNKSSDTVEAKFEPKGNLYLKLTRQSRMKSALQPITGEV